LKIGVRGYWSFSEELEARGKSDRFSYCLNFGKVGKFALTLSKSFITLSLSFELY
jgi:hypothetical protein